MTDMVTCRVCGCRSSLGTAECPDCGAPLPQELSKPQMLQEPSLETVAQPAGEAVKPDKEVPSKKHWLRLAAAFVAVCLVVQGAATLWPQKPTPPGVAMDGNYLITPAGLWDYEAEGFVWQGATDDGGYVLLQKPEDTDTLERLRGMSTILYGTGMSYSYAVTGDYYLFDGITLERTDWAAAAFAGDAVFYTQTDDEGTTFFCRELKTGKEHRIERFEGEGMLVDLNYSEDGTAVAYRWMADGAEEAEAYRLWRRKDRKTVALDGLGDLWGVGAGGETCVFWTQSNRWKNGYRYGENWYSSLSSSWSGYESNYTLWRDGEVVDLPQMMIMWANSGFTQFIFRDYQEDVAEDWYYFDVDAMTEPRPLDVASEHYLSAGRIYESDRQDTLTGRFYVVYGGADYRICYLTRQGELLPVEDGLRLNMAQDDAGRTVVYWKNGELYRLNAGPDDTVETLRLTYTGGNDPEAEPGSVVSFAASDDLSDIYYQAGSGGYSAAKNLYHWHDGESHRLDFEIALSYGSVPMTVTDDGGCYLSYARDLYYTRGDEPPVLLLEEVGMSAFVQLIGAGKWPLLTGAVWEDGKNQSRYWLLNGAKEPTELTEWYPKEGTV